MLNEGCVTCRRCILLACHWLYGCCVVSSPWSVHTVTQNLAPWLYGRVQIMHTYMRHLVLFLHSFGCGLKVWSYVLALLPLYPWHLPTTSLSHCFPHANSLILQCAFWQPSASVSFCSFYYLILLAYAMVCLDVWGASLNQLWIDFYRIFFGSIAFKHSCTIDFSHAQLFVLKKVSIV